jgi:ketosteroid isomerase-like protein
MHTRQEMEQIIRNAYAERKAGDVGRVLACFTDDPKFCVVGAPHPAVGREQAERALRDIMGIECLDYKILDMVIEGQKAAVYWHGRFRGPNGKVEETDLLDLITVEDGRIASFYNFFDTARAQNLIQA